MRMLLNIKSLNNNSIIIAWDYLIMPLLSYFIQIKIKDLKT